MRDLEKMGIEDIERHKYNFKLLSMFLKQIGLYSKFKYLMFLKRKRTPNDLFEAINATRFSSIVFWHQTTNNVCDKKWSALFTYVPFIGFSWYDEKLDYATMRAISRKWAHYLLENNFDKYKSNGNITFKLDGRPFETSKVS